MFKWLHKTAVVTLLIVAATALALIPFPVPASSFGGPEQIRWDNHSFGAYRCERDVIVSWGRFIPTPPGNGTGTMFSIPGCEVSFGDYVPCALNPISVYRVVFLHLRLWFLAVVTGAYPIVFLTHSYHRRRNALRLPRCPNCQYELTGNVSGICPECGKAVRDKTV